MIYVESIKIKSKASLLCRNPYRLLFLYQPICTSNSTCTFSLPQVEDVLLTSAVETLVDHLTQNCDTDADRVLMFYRWMREVETTTPSANEDHAAYYFARSHKQPIALLELFQKLCGWVAIGILHVQQYPKMLHFGIPGHTENIVMILIYDSSPYIWPYIGFCTIFQLDT